MDPNALPLWTDCPWPIPSRYEIRKGMVEGEERILIGSVEHEVFVEAKFKGFSSREDLQAALNNLGGAIFEKEYPNRLLELYRKKAQAAAGLYRFTSEENKILARMKELMP